MQNYHFDRTTVKFYKTVELRTILVGLIEIKYRATLYRAGVKKNKLRSAGICGNLERITPPNFCVFYDLSRLFFKDYAYPISPYSSNIYRSTDAYEKEFRWGDNEIGNRRVAMLDRMIADLTSYLTNKAV